MAEVGRHGAFAVNRIGLDGAPFPLSFSAREASGSWMVDATAAQAAELADVLMRAANDTIVMVDLATNSFLDEDYVQWRPSRIAAEQGVNCQAHLLGALASGVGTGSGQRDRDKPDRGRRAGLGVLGPVSENVVTVNLSATAVPRRLGQRLPERVDRIARYDVRQGLWRLTTALGQG